MALALTLAVDQNATCPPPAGDMSIATYSAAFSGNYPTGGEAVDFSDQFHEVYAVIPQGALFSPAGAGLATGGAYIGGFEPGAGSLNTGFFRVFGDAQGSPPAGTRFAELTAGAYAGSFTVTLTVIGRPITDSQ
jgi:hypothetical protein